MEEATGSTGYGHMGQEHVETCSSVQSTIPFAIRSQGSREADRGSVIIDARHGGHVTMTIVVLLTT